MNFMWASTLCHVSLMCLTLTTGRFIQTDSVEHISLDRADCNYERLAGGWGRGRAPGHERPIVPPQALDNGEDVIMMNTINIKTMRCMAR